MLVAALALVVMLVTGLPEVQKPAYTDPVFLGFVGGSALLGVALTWTAKAWLRRRYVKRRRRAVDS